MASGTNLRAVLGAIGAIEGGGDQMTVSADCRNYYTNLESQLRDVLRIAEITATYAHDVVDWPVDLTREESGPGRQLGHILFLVGKLEEMALNLAKIYYSINEKERT